MATPLPDPRTTTSSGVTVKSGPAKPGPKRRAPTLDELRKSRTVWATMPSGHEFLLRPPTMELHLLSSGLPATVQRMVGTDTNKMAEALSGDDPEAKQAASDYFLHIVRLVVVEPDLTSIETVEDLDALLIPADFSFLNEIAMRERVHDALGRRLWGLEPLTRWESFRKQHGCAEDCEACAALQRGNGVADVLD